MTLSQTAKSPRSSKEKETLSLSEFRKLSEFRFQIRRFLRFSESEARSRGLEPQQHQLLVAVKGLPAGMDPTVANLAHRMQLAHHSMVELIDRVTEKGLAQRRTAPDDRRSTWVVLTPKGNKAVGGISALTYTELQTSFVDLLDSLQRVIDDKPNAARGKKSRAR